MIINITAFQRSNLLQFLNRVQVTGIDEANAFMEVISLIQNAEEVNHNNPSPELDAERKKNLSEVESEKTGR
jgi:hypothetical protein